MSAIDTRQLPLFDVGRGFAGLQGELTEAFQRLGAQGAFSLGEELRAFEEEFATYCGAQHCIGVCDGTDALRLALLGMGVGPGDEVVTVPMTFIGTLEAIAGTGATPVLADIDPETRCLDPEQLRAKLTERTKAVVPVHLYGRPAPMGAIRAAADEVGARILEDAAQAHGARPDEEPRRARRRRCGRHRRRGARGGGALAAPSRQRSRRPKGSPARRSRYRCSPASPRTRSRA